MTFSSSLVIYSLISYIIYLLVFSLIFITFEHTKLDNYVGCNLSLRKNCQKAILLTISALIEDKIFEI